MFPEAIEAMMNSALTTYVQDVLGVSLKIGPWPETSHLPLYLRELYDFETTEVLALPCLLMIDCGLERNPPSLIAKHRLFVEARWKGPVIYISPVLSSVDRSRLVAAKIPFIVPGKQLYLPMVGVDFRELFTKSATKTSHLGSSAQILVLASLFRHDPGLKSPTELAKEFGYSKMTMGRALDELELVGLATCRSTGKERCLVFREAGERLWTTALPLMKNPIRQRIIVDINKTDTESFLVSGLTALSGHSMLATPDRPVYAMHVANKITHSLSKTRIEYPEVGDGTCEIELWSYDPQIFATRNTVDVLSLYLSLKDEDDERIQQALSGMMEKMKW